MLPAGREQLPSIIIGLGGLASLAAVVRTFQAMAVVYGTLAAVQMCIAFSIVCVIREDKACLRDRLDVARQDKPLGSMCKPIAPPGSPTDTEVHHSSP